MTVFFPKPRGQALGGGLEFSKCDDVIVTAFGNFLHWFPAKLTVNQAQSTSGADTVPAVSSMLSKLIFLAIIEKSSKSQVDE